METTTPSRAPFGGESLDGLSTEFLRQLVAAARGTKSAAKGPDECLVARAQLVQRQVDRLQSDMVLSLEDAVETAMALAEQASITADHVSGHERASTARDVVLGLEELVVHLRELEAFFSPHHDEGQDRLMELERRAVQRLDARLYAVVAELRLTASHELRRVELFEEVHELRDIKAAVFGACAQARRVLNIDREFESWCSL